MTKRRFVALDRDGTIIVERHYLSHPEQVELIPRAAAGLRRLSDMGLGLVLITNQSAVGRGFFDHARLGQIHRRLLRLLRAEGVRLSRIYFCPHAPIDDCLCRKPRPALIELAAKELNFDLPRSFVIGDKECDIELGRGVGATTFLVRSGYGARTAAGGKVNPDYVVDDLLEASHVIEGLLTTGERTVTNAGTG